VHETKERLLLAGLQLMLQRGYNATGIQDLLADTGIPKGSFYHHFESKEQFTLQALRLYSANVHATLDEALGSGQIPPLERVRGFFHNVERSYAKEGYLGCFFGALGQELSGTSEVFRLEIEGCLMGIVDRIAACLEEARTAGDLPATTDCTQMANVLTNCWEGAALRTRLRREPEPLHDVLDFFFRSAVRT